MLQIRLAMLQCPLRRQCRVQLSVKVGLVGLLEMVRSASRKTRRWNARMSKTRWRM